MDKYKINYIFTKEEDINDILIKVLNKELKKYLKLICKNNLASYTKVSLNGGKNC